ncbi:MAG: choline/ethanolamine kinase family protein [Pseudomonadota bacterium]
MTHAHDRIRTLPLWQGDIDISPLAGGLSNEGYVVEDRQSGTKTEKYVVRLGDDIPVHHVSRDNERMASMAAHAAGFAPELCHAGDGVLVFRFIDGKTYAIADVVANTPQIIALMKRFHTEMPHHVSGPGRLFWVFHIIRDYARTLRKAGSRFTEQLDDFLSCSAMCEAAQPALNLVYGHSDLLPANFLHDGNRLWLIDYEYAAFSSPLFDLANLASNALFTPEQDAAMLKAYFGATPDHDLMNALSAMKCASLLREAMWSMVSEHHLKAPGVDYAAYSDEILENFRKERARHNATYA